MCMQLAVQLTSEAIISCSKLTNSRIRLGYEKRTHWWMALNNNIQGREGKKSLCSDPFLKIAPLLWHHQSYANTLHLYFCWCSRKVFAEYVLAYGRISACLGRQHADTQNTHAHSHSSISTTTTYCSYSSTLSTLTKIRKALPTDTAIN